MPLTFATGSDLAQAFARLRSARRGGGGGFLARLRRTPRPDLDTLAKRILLPSLPVSDEEMARATHREKGRKLARQESWAEFADMVDYADAARLTTHGGAPAALLLAEGARADVVAAAQDAICDGAKPEPQGLEALEEMQAEHPESYPCALVVAMAHHDIGLAWRNSPQAGESPTHHLKAQTHFDRAAEILATFDAVECDSPALAAGGCTLICTRPRPGRHLARGFKTLIDLDPDSPRHMRRFGRAILEKYDTPFAMLERAARRTAERTAEVWGAGGYVWVYLDALARDQRALREVDAALFVGGMRDILAVRDDQHVVNQLAAFCALPMAPRGLCDKELPATAEATRAELHDCLDWLLSRHLQELHPYVWARAMARPSRAPKRPPRRALVQSGRQAALRVIAERYADEIADGSSLAFSRSGMYRLPAL
jgi:hypothetical protein